MRTALIIFTVVLLSVLAGCDGAAGKKDLLKKGGELLTVDFQKNSSLRYRFVSSRDIALDWDPEKTRTRPGQSSLDKITETMEMVVTYTPVEVDPFGLTTIKATCESVKAARSKGQGRRDTVENLPGKTFNLKVNASGKIEDYSQLDEIIRELGENAFRKSTRLGRVKEPDMIADFVATQWFLWDSVSSIEKPTEGVSVGQSWKSRLSIPTPMVMREARDVTYTLAEIRPTDKGRLAVINSTYTMADSAPESWPIPYTGSFQMSGTFGFFRGYPIQGLEGSGEEIFNIDAGRIEQYNQQYQMKLDAVLPGPLGPNPKITINQKLSMQLLN